MIMRHSNKLSSSNSESMISLSIKLFLETQIPSFSQTLKKTGSSLKCPSGIISCPIQGIQAFMGLFKNPRRPTGFLPFRVSLTIAIPGQAFWAPMRGDGHSIHFSGPIAAVSNPADVQCTLLTSRSYQLNNNNKMSV